MTHVRLTLANADATASLAQRLAPILRPADVILLEGPIGAGKTHFARALIQARLAAEGVHEDVPSPTFTLVQVYQAGEVEIWHADLYRLTHPDEAAELGLDEAFETAVCLVEWPERLGPYGPQNALHLRLTPQPGSEERVADFFATDPRWAELFIQLEQFDG